MASISSVQDPNTGGNYSGIRRDPLGMDASQKKYIDNLLEATSRPVGGPLRSQEQYTPSAGRSPVIGHVSSQTLGSVPIFGSGAAIFPQAILDQFAQAKKEAELAYLNQLGSVSMEDFQLTSTLNNPWHNQAFNSKYQEALDTWLDNSAAMFGGDYKKGMLYLKGNKDYHRMLKSYGEYAEIYNAVYDDAVGILSADPTETYVSDTSRRAAIKFVQDYEKLDEYPIDKMVSMAKQFKSHISAMKLAEMTTDGMGQRIVENYVEASGMGTDEVNVFMKQTQEGFSQEDLNQIYESTKEAYPQWFQDEAFANQFRAQLEQRADFIRKKSLTEIKKSESKTETYLKKHGINVDEEGRVETIESIPTAFQNFGGGKFSTGRNGIVYPSRDMDNKPVVVQTQAGMNAYVIDNASGELYYVNIPSSYPMVPQKEYSVGGEDAANGGMLGKRFVEGQVNFKRVGLHSSEQVKSKFDDEGNLITANTGIQNPLKEEDLPVSLKDIYTGNKINLYGNYTVIATYDSMKDGLDAAYPFLKRTHADIKDLSGNLGVPTENTIPVAKPKLQRMDKKPRNKDIAYEYPENDYSNVDMSVWKSGDIIKVGEDKYYTVK